MDQNPLFSPYQLGRLMLPNRMIMAPMTRGRANPDGTPNSLMAQYYSQRATAGLIVTEATPVSRKAIGWVGAPGIYTDTHVSGWSGVTDSVHRAGGRIFLQLWHMGRVSHPDFLMIVDGFEVLRIHGKPGDPDLPPLIIFHAFRLNR